MISKLEIKGFKSLVDVSIELGAVNVFIGANGSGKSNLLEAVGFLSAIVQGGLEAEPLRYRGVREGVPASICTSMTDREQQPLSFAAVDDLFGYSVEFEPEKLHPSRWSITKESGDFKGSTIFVRSNDRITYAAVGGSLPVGTSIEFAVDSELRRSSFAKFALLLSTTLTTDKSISSRFEPFKSNENYRLLEPDPTLFDLLGRFAIFTPSTPNIRGSRTDIQREPLGLSGSGLGQAIDEMLKSEPDKLGPFELDEVYELIDWADSLTIDETNDQATRLRIGDRYMGNGHKTVSLLESSEGALYVLFLLALVGHADSPPIFAVDNFDQALHPRLACALTEKIADQILADGTRQMLATTHNPLVLDGLDLLDDRVRLFTVDRDKSGATQVNRVLVSEELMAQADKGLSLSQLWVMGRLGGVPKFL